MKITHKNKDKTIRIESKRGKACVDRHGMVNIIGGNYKHLDKLSIRYIEANFREVV